MKTISIAGKRFQLLLEEAGIRQRVCELAAKLSHDYAGKQPVFLPILNGSFVFAADLLRELSIPFELEFVKIQSYAGMESTGTVTSSFGIGTGTSLADRDLIIVEDIIETGQTIVRFIADLQAHKPRSVQVASLLRKPSLESNFSAVDYLGFEIPEKFVIGYGLDVDGQGRGLKDIYELA